MISKDKIISIIQSELSSSNMSDNSNYLENSLNAYLGGSDGREIEGRSHIISTDVADAIEWILPQIMKSFTQNNEIVVFDPVHEGDEKQAELESQYVYEILMKQNDGFIILHQFVKDALMQRVGILKVYYMDKTERKITDWTGITEEQLDLLLSKDEIELLEMSEEIDQYATMQKREQINAQINNIRQQVEQGIQQVQQVPLDAEQQLAQADSRVQNLQAELEKPVLSYDVKVAAERKKGKIYVDPIPREEFRINSKHNSINTSNARFTAHVTTKTKSDVLDEFNLSLEDVADLPEGSTDYEREYRFSLQEGSVFYGDESEDESQKELEISECFLNIDMEGNGHSKLMKITVAGADDTITDILLIEELDVMPWITTTAFLMSHKFEGRSVTDRLIDIQEQKTTLWRNMFDNMYFQNNQRNKIIESQVNMDDLLVSRPGGNIRVKRMDAIEPLITPQLGQDAYNMMDYLDKVRASRTGVEPDGAGSPQNIGDRVGSQGVDRLMNAKEELVGLIIRVIAETGIKPLCIKLRDLSINHIDSIVDFKFRGVWQQINPATWCDRTSTTVRVGTGTGNHQHHVAALREVLLFQEKIIADPNQTVLDEQKIFNTLDDFCKFTGLNGATRYFIDPSSPQGEEKAQQNQQASSEQSEKESAMEQEIVQVQRDLAQAEQTKANAQQQNASAKAQIDFMKVQIESLEQKLKEAKAMSDADQKRYETDAKVAIELTKIESAARSQENQNYKENLRTASSEQ